MDLIVDVLIGGWFVQFGRANAFQSVAMLGEIMVLVLFFSSRLMR
ncbi:MAG: hypothetical protein ACR2P6_07340 [Gammaproteobacteria bacterium]